MDQHVKKFSAINYEGEDVLGQINKRFKPSEQELIDDIATSIESIAWSTESIGESHALFLEVNKSLTQFLLKCERQNREKILAQTETSSSLHQRLENNSSKSTK